MTTFLEVEKLIAVSFSHGSGNPNITVLDSECEDGPENPSTSASLKMAEVDEGI